MGSLREWRESCTTRKHRLVHTNYLKMEYVVQINEFSSELNIQSGAEVSTRLKWDTYECEISGSHDSEHEITAFWNIAQCSLYHRCNDGDSIHLSNVGILQRDYTALYPRKLSPTHERFSPYDFIFHLITFHVYPYRYFTSTFINYLLLWESKLPTSRDSQCVLTFAPFCI
jgi:hypothetical protein